MASKKKITLMNVKTGAKTVFDFAHALNILRREKRLAQNAWEIAEKNWKFENNEIFKRAVTGTSEESETSE